MGWVRVGLQPFACKDNPKSETSELTTTLQNNRTDCWSSDPPLKVNITTDSRGVLTTADWDEGENQHQQQLKEDMRKEVLLLSKVDDILGGHVQWEPSRRTFQGSEIYRELGALHGEKQQQPPGEGLDGSLPLPRCYLPPAPRTSTHHPWCENI